MKLHLPLSLRSAIYAMFAALVGNVPAQAGIMHSDATLITYTDFGQNVGRYKTMESANALLQHIRQQEGGVTITYTGGQQTYVMPHGMIDFGSTYHVATCAAISPAAIATVAHNYTFDSWFSNKVYGIGMENAVKYKGIELGWGVGDSRWNSNVFSHALSTSIGNATDHRVMRLSKVITDAPYAELYDTAGKDLGSLTYYHAGSGQQWRSTYNTTTLVDRSYPNNASQLISAYNYVIGGIVSGAAGYAGTTGFYSQEYFDAGGINASDPLTWVSRPGDSGSPLYVWDKDSGTYQYIGSNRGEILSGQVGSAFVTNTAFDKQVVDERYTKRVNMGTVGTVYLNAVSTQGETVTDDEGYSTTKWLGTVTGAGMETVSFVGLQSGVNTWSDLSGLKDTQAWYAYDQSYVAQSNADLFFTENLVFNATAKENSIVLNDTVDLGIGYAEFSGGKFTISSAEGESNLFNHAGYVINEGAEVHVQLTNPAEYMREWRKIGAGDLYIEGSGNNDVLLNLGGSGKTYLNREGGYAAYNVLVNTGATVVISDVGQIKRDLTFGNRGGTLDMNGKSMDWYTTAEAADSTRAGFSINALTEDALVANYSGSSTLTYKEAGNTAYAGSFADSADSSLKIIYDEAEGTWTLNSIRTNLQHSDSGLQVDSGTVVLRGTNTIHGAGSASGLNENRYSHEDDWHYADAAMNVTVTDGGTFELGSHARLTGNVTVASGGTYVMREGVRHTQEYVEGGQVLEDTGKYAAYFGHKGDVVLNGGTFAVQFNEGVDSTTSYAGCVTGTGAMTVDAGTDGGTFAFSGEVADGVSKTLNRGQLQLSGTAAADTTNKWLVNAGGVMVQFENAADTLGVIDAASTGVLGLNADTTTQLDLSSHSQLGIGALSGTTVQYGAAGTSEKLSSLNLGGGGTLVVNYALSGSDTLNVDGRGWSSGEVRLANVASGYSGTVNVAGGGGRVLLTTAEDGVFAGATVNINNGGVWQLNETQSAASARTLNVNEGGTLRGKNMVFAGAGTSLELRGSLDYDSFTVQDGATLNLRDGGRLDAENAATISGTGVMRLNRLTLSDKVNLENGGTMYGNGGTIGSGAKVLATAGTGKLNAGGGTFDVNGTIGAAEGATLRLENGTFSIYHGNLNADGGTLELATANISLGYLQSNGTQNIGGTLKIAENVTITANQTSTDYQRITHNVNHIHIDDGKSLSITETSNSWAHQWNIGSLTGAGEITWSANPNWYASGTSRMRLTGENDFSGTLVVKQLYGGWSSLNDYSIQHLELAHDKAAHRMVISLQGDADSHPGLAINTNNAKVAGLEGTANTYLYAGPMKTGWQGGPGSSALNTLTITGDGDYTFNGSIVGDAANGLNIVMNGSGTQTFTKQSNVHDVSALEGKLIFSRAPIVHGDVSIAQGAELTMGSGDYYLDPGQRLNVLAGTAGASATLTNSLVISGGEISFGAFDSTAASLNAVGGVSADAGLQSLGISFTNQNAIQLGTSYLLASGDWSAFEGRIMQSERGYLGATLTAGSSGLSAVFSMKEGYVYGEGNADVLQSGAKVVFSGKGDLYTLDVPGSPSINTGVFDVAQDFTINSALSATSLEKYGDGALVVNAAVTSDSMYVQDSASLKGTGQISTGTLEIESGAQVHVEGATLDVQSAIEGEGSLHVGEGGTLQVRDATTGSVQLTDGATLATTGAAVATAVTLGATDETSVVTMRFAGNGLRLNGLVAVQGDTALEVQGRGELSFHSEFNNLSSLNLKSGVNLNQTSELRTHLVLDGGTASAKGAKILKGDITVKNGGTFTFAGDTSVCDTLDFDASNKTISVSGATLNFGNTRQTMGGWSLLLSDGASVTGDGGIYDDKQAALDFNSNNSTIYATSGSSTISATTRLRDGNNLNYDVSEGATLTVSGLIHADGASGKGSITKDGEGTLVLTKANTYADTTTVNEGTLRTATDGALGTSAVVINGGTLELNPTGGEYVNASILKGAVTVNGGELLIKGDNNKVVDTNVTVNAGGTMRFAGSGSDMLDYNQPNKSITVDGGTLDFGNTRQTMGSWGLTLKNGATITGAGGSYGVKYTAALDLNQNFTIRVEDGENTIESNVRMRGGNDRTLTFNVSDEASVKVTGRIHADGDDALGIITKEGSGSVEIASRVTANTLNSRNGELVLSHTAAENVVGMLDGSQDGSSTGTVRLAQGAALKVTGEIWGRSNSAIVLEEGATLTNVQDGVMVTNHLSVNEARLVNNSNNGEYAVNNSDFELVNGYLKNDSSTSRTLSNKLTNSVIDNASKGGATLTVDNAANNLMGIVAGGGDVTVLNQAALSINLMEIATGRTVGLYTGADASSEKAAVMVSNSATFGAGATLNTACLTIADGATLDITGLDSGNPVVLNGALTFGNFLKMGENLLASVETLDYGESLALFTGVQGFSLPMLIDSATDVSVQVQASVFFDDMADQNDYFVKYQVIDNVGSLLVVHVPEPTTATLSLLALAGLAARRRRKA